MAINFPSSPSNGEEYTDANSGTWTYDSGTNSWTLTAGGSTSAFNFRGGHDFRSSTPPADPIESGDMWIHDASTGTIDNVYTGISGQIANGQLVLWDGNSYVMISGTLPGYPDVGDGEGGTLDSRYLKLGAGAGAQTVATTQPTTFNGRGEFGGGVEVTGGNPANIDNGLALISSGPGGSQGLYLTSDQAIRLDSAAIIGFEGEISAAQFGNNASVLNGKVTIDYTDSVVNGAAFGCDTFSFTGSSDTDTFACYRANSRSNTQVANAPGTVYGFSVFSNLTGLATDNVYGFHSSIGESADQSRFNFYAGGTAPNYFGGKVIANINPENPNLTGEANIYTKCSSSTASDSGIEIISTNSANNNARKAIRFTKVDSNDVEAVAEAGFIQINGSVGAASSITLVSSDGSDPFLVTLSDYRTKILTSFSGNAADTVKQLNPGTNGFIAHELSSVIPSAVIGTKDETEAIGTLADYDGIILKTEVTEPDELEYTEESTDEYGVSTQIIRTRTWTPTGTRPVYQGVDQTKLIPLLTKALQEALERIEVLEAAAGY